MDDAHRKEVRVVCEEFGVNPEVGLSPAQVEKAREKHGWNETPPAPTTPYWKLLLEQFEDLLVRILLAAAIVSFVLAFFEEGDSTTAFVEPFVIMWILIANAIVGVWQESNAEAAIEALKTFVSKTAVVLREGRLSTIPARELVPGDIVQVAVGSQMPADLRMLTLQSTTVRVDQALLTGESDAVMKDADVVTGDDRWPTNLLFSGTSVAYGKCLGVAVQIGTATEYGKIEQSMMEEEDVATPLKKKLDEFGELLSKVIGVVCILVWLVNIGHFTDPAHGSMLRGAVYYFKIAVALAVAAIPEGLPAVVTTCLALGTRKMAAKNALIRSLPSVETLGCTSVICSDKTGTLTTNMMSVAKVCLFDGGNLREFNVDDTGFSVSETALSEGGNVLEHPLGTCQGLGDIARICALCNDATLEWDAEKKEGRRMGEATEAALLVLAEKIGLRDPSEHAALAKAAPQDRIGTCSRYWASTNRKGDTLEFTRSRKSMSVSAQAEGKHFLFVKGAPENIIARSKYLKLASGDIVELNGDHKRILEVKLKDLMAGQHTLRCLGLAYRSQPDPFNRDLMSNPDNFERLESDLTLVGVVGMLDPPRKEVRAAIEKCGLAGIRVIVITGDNKDTAEAICRRIGVFGENESVEGKSFTGVELDRLSEEQKIEAVRHARLFSRVDPNHKMTLVKLLQKEGEVAAMTGDGVNDAPALKKADIGIAMGGGTEVAQAAGKMVLSDDNFSTIVSAVEEGRAIYNNTKQFIRYLISSNIGEVVCIFLTAALGMPEALVPVQLLWVNLVTDGFPATALGFNPPDADIMNNPPRKGTEPIVNGWLFFRYLAVGIYVGVATVGGFAWWFLYYEGGPMLTWSELTSFHGCVEGAERYSCSIFTDKAPSTVALSVLVTVEMFNALNAVSEDMSILQLPPTRNIWLLLAIMLSFALHFLILYVPILRTIFGVNDLCWEEWKAVLIISFPVILLDEVLKLISRILQRSRRAAAKKED